MCECSAYTDGVQTYFLRAKRLTARVRSSMNLFKWKKQTEPQARTLEQSWWGLVFEESILEERTLGYVGVLLWKIPVSSHSLCKKRKCINVNLIIPNMAPGQLPPPANQITRQWRKEKTVFEKTSSGCERGGAGDSTDAAMQSLEGGALQEHVGRRDREEHFRWFAIHSRGNSISRKIPLQQMKELHSSLGKNVFQGRASEPSKTRISLGGPWKWCAQAGLLLEWAWRMQPAQ